jgi:Flp pilus assembly protein TadB
VRKRLISTRKLVILLAILGAGIAVWPANDVTVLGLGIVTVALIAAALIAYFEWRTNLRRRITAEAEDYRQAA